MADSNIYALCFAQGDAEPSLLLVRRQFIQKRADGQAIRGSIPAWAGQWGLVAGQPKEAQPVEDAACALFFAQTGVDLADPQTASAYGVTATRAGNLQDSDYNPVPVFYVTCSPAGLASLAKDIQGKLLANAPADGLLQTAEMKRVSEARSLVGPIPPPPDGWKNYLIKNYWDGKPPGQLNTEIDTLTAAITASSAQPPTGSRIAIDSLPNSGTPPSPPPVVQPIETYALIADNNPYPVTIRAIVAKESDWASTTNRPDKTFAGVAIDPFGDVSGRADLAGTASSARVQVEMTVDGGAETIVFSYDQKAALAASGEQTIGIFGKDPQYIVTQSTGNSAEGKPQLTLVISENRED